MKNQYGNDCDGDAMGDNAGKGNRAVAAHVKSQHNGAGKSGNSVSGMMKPARTLKQPGASASSLKQPRATSRPIGG